VSHVIEVERHLPPAAVSRAALPVVYERAKRSLAKCERLDECTDWADKAAALASYAKQAEDETLLNHALRIQTRAYDRAGELLKLIEPQQGGDRKSKRPAAAPLKTKRQQAATDAGLSSRQAKTAIRVNNVERDSFEKQVESDKPPTVAVLAKQGTKRRTSAAKRRQRADAVDAQDRATAVFSGNAMVAIDRAREGCKAKRITQAHVNTCQLVIDAWTKLKKRLDNRRKP
jgi:hypothetical protein